MPRSRHGLIPILAAIVAFGPAAGARADDPAKVTFTILQLNDVYEVIPLDHGASGGLARVAGLRKTLAAKEPNTFTLLAGDTLGPSPMGNAKLDGVAIAGRQTVECWNALGLDYATFGNHEFDLRRDQFLARLRESDFTWVSSNVTDRAGNPFPAAPGELVLDVRNEKGDSLRVGLIGLTIEANPVSYVRIAPHLDAARAVQGLRGRADVIIALTHLDLDEDRQIAAALPEIALIVGGHEHIRHYVPPGRSADGRPTPPIAKADANARSAWVHRFAFDPATRRLDLDSSLRTIDASIAPDRATTELIERWWIKFSVAFFQDNRVLPGDIVAMLDQDLDGRELYARSEPTNLARLIGQAMIVALDAKAKAAGVGADLPRLAVFNSGIVRIDDVLPAGPLTAYDLHRTLPYPNTLRGATMTGALVADLLARNPRHVGNGPFLQAYDADGVTLLEGPPRLDPAKTYLVALPDFLIDGREQGFADLDTTRAPKPGLAKPPALDDLGPLREAVVALLRTGPKLEPPRRPTRVAGTRFDDPARVTIQLPPAAR